MALDSIVRPDAVHFGAAAKQLITNASLLIPTGPFQLPARTLPGASLVMCLTQWMQPQSLTAGIWAIWISSLLAAFLAYQLGKQLNARLGGITAAFMILLSPLHAYYSRQLMSDIPWGALTLASAFLFTI